MALRDVAGHRGRTHGAFADETGTPQNGTSRVSQGATDAELMAGIGRGEEPSLAELLRRHWRAIVCYAGALVDADTAEDVAQETFLRANAHAARWRPLGSVRTYLLHIARNIALNERRRQRNRSSMLEAARSTLVGRSTPTPSELLEESQLRDVILQALDLMPERRREVFALIRFGGLPYSEAAAVMGTSEQTAANQMSAAMADLRRAIKPFADDSP